MYARIADGYAIDPVSAVSNADVARFFHPGYIANKGGLIAWVSVPDGTLNGAKDNGNGTFTNPGGSSGQPREVRKWEFATFASTAVGGAAAFGVIVKACRDSADNAVIGAYELFKSQATLAKSEADAFLTLLVVKSIATSQQKADILAAWPQN